MRLKRTAAALLAASIISFQGTAVPFNIREVYAAQTAAEPQIAAQGAVLINASSGEVLFGKNENKRFYPASVTKILTALLVIENTDMDDMVRFSASATSNMEAGAVSLGVSEGDNLSVRDSLYGLLLKSANEVANGLAEHVGGSVAGFADMMNARAAALGCRNTNFVNPNGLNNASHYTSAYDMALIAKACFANEEFRKIASTPSYTFPAIKKSGSRLLIMGHKMIHKSDSRYYEGAVGGKTGYTSKAGNTLVTCAERNGIRLIAVVLKSSSTQYSDTKALLDYGFAIGGVKDSAYKDAALLQDASESAGNTVIGPGAEAKGPGAGKDSGMIVAESKPDSERADANTSAGSGNEADNTGSTAILNQKPAGNAAAGNADSQSGPGVVRISPLDGDFKKGWNKDGEKWYYIKENSSRAAAEIIQIEGCNYWFDRDGYMATGWRLGNDRKWYCMRESGSMRMNSWTEYKGSWYYLGADGAMFTSAVTPDGYKVNSEGVWIQ